MDAKLKTVLIVVLGIVSLLFLGLAVSSCMNSGQNKKARDKEMALRLDLEEKLSKLNDEKAVLDKKLEINLKDLATEQSAHEATKKLLSQEQMLSENLKAELES
jgi:hypothetical protein